jgi:multiple sugar transport system ATP-binding protein
MNRGVLQQVDTPQQMYDRPSNLFVAGFIGSPAMNMAEADLRRDGDATYVEFGGLRLLVPSQLVAGRPALERYIGKRVAVGIRPEDIEDPEHAARPVEGGELPVVVEHREAMGSEVYAHFQVDAPPVVTDDTRDLAADAELLDVVAADAAQRRTPFVARLNPRTSAALGQPIRLQVDTGRIHFFDLATGEAI